MGESHQGIMTTLWCCMHDISLSLVLSLSITHTFTLIQTQQSLQRALTERQNKRPMSTTIQDVTCKEQLRGEGQKMELL